jgi:hypothetical protein
VKHQQGENSQAVFEALAPVNHKLRLVPTDAAQRRKMLEGAQVQKK